MPNRTWNIVDKFFSENEFQSFIVQNAVSIKRTEEIEAGKKLFFSYDGGITVSTSNEHNHAHRASTTRAPSPVREIVINSVAAGLSYIQTHRAIEHQYEGVVSRSQLCSLLNYHRSLKLPDQVQNNG
ncbi:unnamed protein product [Rotaria sp. Silwood1]|nr:unnamed protein product [Rotaria sp. Silwood1]CAF0970891.1 unnamed protein product [Rotaria sp. Silwood1]